MVEAHHVQTVSTATSATPTGIIFTLPVTRLSRRPRYARPGELVQSDLLRQAGSSWRQEAESRYPRSGRASCCCPEALLRRPQPARPAGKRAQAAPDELVRRHSLPAEPAATISSAVAGARYATAAVAVPGPGCAATACLWALIGAGGSLSATAGGPPARSASYAWTVCRQKTPAPVSHAPAPSLSSTVWLGSSPTGG